MDQKTKLTIIGGAVLLVIAIIFVTIFYFGRASRTGIVNGDGGTNPLVQLPTIAPTISPTTQSGDGSSQGKTLSGQGFSLTYPSSWGALTCSNSQNFELDPTSSVDVRGVVCETAVKPVTVLVVSRLSCTGETVTLGNNRVVKSKTETSTGINYHWCVSVGGKGLDISHRVSSTGSRATSKDDFSAQVEQIITTIKPSPQAS